MFDAKFVSPHPSNPSFSDLHDDETRRRHHLPRGQHLEDAVPAHLVRRRRGLVVAALAGGLVGDEAEGLSSLADVAQHHAVFPGGNTFTHHIVQRLFEAQGLTPNIAMSTNYLETIKMMVSIGLGWSVLPATMADEVRANGRIPLIIGRGLTDRARSLLNEGPSDMFLKPEQGEDTGKGYTLAQKMVGKAAGMDGVKSATVDFDNAIAMVEFDEAKVTPTSLEETVKKTGETYTVKNMKTVESFSAKKGEAHPENCDKDCCKGKTEASADTKVMADKEKKECKADCKMACCADKKVKTD